jgi:hypothetical protein
MARKKKSAQPDSNGDAAPAPANGSASTSNAKKPAGEPSTSALIICRNK